jgi:hypothetical protein
MKIRYPCYRYVQYTCNGKGARSILVKFFQREKNKNKNVNGIHSGKYTQVCEQFVQCDREYV